jgi:hypothetical protein
MAHQLFSTACAQARVLYGLAALCSGLVPMGCSGQPSAAPPDQDRSSLQAQNPAPATSGNGSAAIRVPLNTWPVVTRTAATPSYLTKGAPTQLSVSATDADGDPLTFAWSSTCPGTFTNAQTATPAFTLDTGATATSCTLAVAVADNRGGSTQGALTLAVGQAAPVLAPTITMSLQSPDLVGGNSPVAISVSATDPQGLALSFSWSTDGGALGAPNSTADSSQVVWTSPATPAPSWHVTVVVSNGSATTSKTFTVRPL